MPSFSLSPGLSRTQLRALLREKVPTLGSSISAAESELLAEIALHPNADTWVRNEVSRAVSAREAPGFEPTAETNRAESTASVLAARSTEGGLDLFGLPEAELGSIPERYDAHRLSRLFDRQNKNLRDGKKITKSELSWCHLLAVHPNADQDVRTQVADFLEGRKLSDGLQPVVQRLLKGLRGQASLAQAPKPPSSTLSAEIPRAKNHVFMAPDLDAAELGFFLDKKLKELMPHNSPSTPELAASMLEMATHQNADVFFRRKVGQRLIEHRGFKVLDERLRVGAKTLLAGGTITLGDPLLASAPSSSNQRGVHNLASDEHGRLLMPVGLRPPKLKLPEEDTSTKDLIEFVAKHMADCQQRWGESFNIQAGFLSWAISVSQMPNADDEVRKALGKALLSRPRQEKWKPIIDVFAEVLAKGENVAPHGFTLHFGAPGPIEGVKPEMEISALGLQQTLDSVEKLLVEAAGSDALLEAHEVDGVLKMLGPVQRQSVQRFIGRSHHQFLNFVSRSTRQRRLSYGGAESMEKLR